MRTFLTIASSIALWILVLTKFNAMWRRRHENEYRHLVSRVWLTAVLLGTSLLLLVDPVQVWVGGLFRLNNFAWYLSYLAGSVAFQQVGYLSVRQYRPIGRRTQLLSALPVTLLLIIFSILYFGWIRWTPEWPARSPRTWADALFMILFFGHASVAGFVTIWIQAVDYWRRPALIVRLRTGLRIATALLANACFLLKIAYTIAAYRTPSAALAEQINQWAFLCMGAAAIFFSIQLASHKTFVKLVDILQMGHKLALLRDLRFLQARLLRLCPPVAGTETDWWTSIRQIDRQLYQTVISILDSHKMLNGYLKQVKDDQETTLIIQMGNGSIVWNLAEIQEARRLLQLLQPQPEGGLEELMDFYRRVAVDLRREQNGSPATERRLPWESSAPMAELRRGFPSGDAHAPAPRQEYGR